MTVKDFVNKYLLMALRPCLERGYNSAVAFTCLCQVALETGWLKSDLMRENNAPFGIKWYEGCGYDYYEASTREVINGQSINVIAKFKKYNTMEEAFNDYYNLLEGKRYRDCLKATTVRDCITIIKNNGYATDPNYINSIMAVYDTIVKAIR